MVLAAGALVALAHVGAIVAFCFSAAQLIAGLVDGRSADELGGPVIATAASVLARALTQAALDALAVRGAARVKSQLRRRVLDAVDARGASGDRDRPSADIATLIGPGLDALDGYIGRYLPQLVLTAVATPVVVGALLLADAPTGIAVVLTLPLIPLFMVLIGWATQAVQRRQWQALTTLSRGFLEVVQGLSTLMIFGRQHRQVARIEAVTEQYRRRTMRVLRVSFLSSFALELAASLSVAIVAVSVGVRLIDGVIALALGLFVLVLVPEAYLPLRQVGAQYHAAAEGLAAAEEVLDLLDAAPTAAPSPVPSVERAALADETIGDAPPPALRLTELVVRRAGRPVVDGLSGAWAGGLLLAVTGESGVGKSSLLAALRGALPAEGRIAIAGRSAHAAELAAHVAWAGQRPDLTAGPLAAVVALGAEHPDTALVQRALRLAAVDDVPADLVLGPGGDGLSGGQAQRVAIARAAYRALERRTPLVLLDEPTSALDAATELRVIAGLRALAAEGALVVVVTHRPAVIAAADERLDLQPAGVPA
ncbi:thiol reductant ABC exporter subunit CydD [Microcella daejeonensis]|uniref:thiol reductant ABC exporter subunit CydD n=1 Tax=Microcella daejeonensis TaxID=2994971 RepID=UPI00226F6EBD|nr:thiol reductant ABC exporter subunit CydD [Microcella daejeonensis]WAB83727.1 thiol reductant ABC exporter subunit CydD [Microcella daejeonensis]